MSMVADRPRPREEGRSCSVFPSRTPAERLTDDILVEILSRVPAKELCRCKCVSKHWLGRIHHPDHRKRLPQTLAGFFYGSSTTGQHHFTSLLVSGDPHPPFDTSFTFLPHHLPIDLLDSCNILLLCRCYDVSVGVGAFHYVGCNPATEKWVILPKSGKVNTKVAATCLGFDPTLSLHFHVFELIEENTDLSGMAVYSSETREWVYKEKRWNSDTWFANGHSSATGFLNGLLFFRAFDLDLHDCVAAVDTKGETWMKFSDPGGQFDDFGMVEGFIQRSRARYIMPIFRGIKMVLSFD